MGAHCAAEFNSLAREYALRVTCRLGQIHIGSADGVFVQTLRKWRTELSCSIQAGNAAMISKSLGITFQAAVRSITGEGVESPGRMAHGLRSENRPLVQTHRAWGMWQRASATARKRGNGSQQPSLTSAIICWDARMAERHRNPWSCPQSGIGMGAKWKSTGVSPL